MPARATAMAALATLLACLTTLLGSGPARGAKPSGQLPTWAQVNEAVAAYFEALPDYQPGALIVRSEVKGVLEKLEELGWPVADRKEILELVAADGEFLASNLRKPAGRKFMSQIAKYPLGYDRLDRLSRLPRGKTMVRDLIRGPDGYKMIQYMTTAPGGTVLGEQLSQAPDGKSFNKPTGRIYTVKMLQAHLEESYKRAREAAAPQQGTQPVSPKAPRQLNESDAPT